MAGAASVDAVQRLGMLAVLGATVLIGVSRMWGKAARASEGMAPLPEHVDPFP